MVLEIQLLKLITKKNLLASLVVLARSDHNIVIEGGVPLPFE